MIDYVYVCNLCEGRGPDAAERFMGFRRSATGAWMMDPNLKLSKFHLCFRCLAEIQAFPRHCGQGVACDGGPACQKKHDGAPA